MTTHISVSATTIDKLNAGQWQLAIAPAIDIYYHVPDNFNRLFPDS